MLLYFKTSNNYSFDEKVEFSMIAAKYKSRKEEKEELENNLVHSEKYDINILKSAVIYGANASGKTNLLKAIEDGIRFIKGESQFNIYEEDLVSQIYNKNNPSNINKPTSYTFGLVIDEILFEYSFSIDRNKIVNEYLDEYITQKPTRQFERLLDSETETYKWKFSKYFIGEKETVKKITNENTLYLTNGAKTKLQVCETVFEYLSKKIAFSINSKHPGNIGLSYTLKLMDKFPDIKNIILNEISNADFLINDIIIDEFEENNDGTKKVRTTHKNSVTEKDANISFDLYNEESAGTKQYIAWVGIITNIIIAKRTLFIDELGNNMHPLLLEHLIKFFNKNNKDGKAQLIFTTHDTNLMNSNLFRRDQYFIVERNKQGNSEIYSLSDFKIKKDSLSENKYLQGVYGGIPHLQD